jgi:hypothetical protein
MKNIFDRFLFGAVIALSLVLVFIGAIFFVLIVPLMLNMTFGPLAGIFSCMFAIAIIGGIATVITDMI